MITSAHNRLVKDLRRIQSRRVRGRFVAEGEDLIAAAERAGWEPERLLRAGIEIDAELLAELSLLAANARTLGIFDERWALPRGPLCVALWGVRDPGNVGTVLRSALAFGADSVVIGPQTADPYGPKAVRASMGAIFAVPVARATAISELPGTTIALDAAADGVLPGAQIAAQATTIVVGAERAGLSAAVLAACTKSVRIPIAAAADSLNAAMAATLALYELSGDRSVRSTL